MHTQLTHTTHTHNTARVPQIESRPLPPRTPVLPPLLTLRYTLVYTDSIIDVSTASAVTVGTPCGGGTGLTSPVAATITVVEEGATYIPYSASASTVATRLSRLPNVGPVNVLVALPDARAILRWTVTLVSLPANVNQMECTLTGAGGITGADCHVVTLSQVGLGL
jgi:hypothetical protein